MVHYVLNRRDCSSRAFPSRTNQKTRLTKKTRQTIDASVSFSSPFLSKIAESMPKRLKPNELTKKALEDRIKVADTDKEYKTEKRSRNELISIAKCLGAISNSEVEASVYPAYKTVKSYLHTVLKNDLARERIESLVCRFSVIWFRSFQILNLLSLEYLIVQKPFRSDDEENDEPIECAAWQPSTGLRRQRLAVLYRELTLDNSPLLRELFLLEKDKEPKHEELCRCMNVYREHLEHLDEYVDVDFMQKTGWSQLSSHAATKMKTAILLKIRSCVGARIKQYVRRIWPVCQGRSKGYSDDLIRLLTQMWPREVPNSIIPEDVRHIWSLRRMLGMAATDTFDKYPMINEDLFDFYVYLIEMGMVDSIMPKPSLSRKYCYFDERI